MTIPNYTHNFADPEGHSYTVLSQSYARDGQSGSVAINLSPSMPSANRQEALKEYTELAKTLDFEPTMLKNGTLLINTGTRSAEGFMFFVASDLEDKKLIKEGEAHKGIEATIHHEERWSGHALHEQDPLLATLKELGRKFKQTGSEYTDKGNHDIATVAGENKGNGLNMVKSGKERTLDS